MIVDSFCFLLKIGVLLHFNYTFLPSFESKNNQKKEKCNNCNNRNNAIYIPLKKIFLHTFKKVLLQLLQLLQKFLT